MSETAKRVAIEVAKRSRHSKSLVGAALVRRGKVLDVKCNISSGRRAVSVCAETRLLRDPPRAGLRGAEIYVARVTKTGQVTMARPCAACAIAIARRQIERVHFTDWSGNWQTETVEELLSRTRQWEIRSHQNVWDVRKRKLISYAPGAPVGQ